MTKGSSQLLRWIEAEGGLRAASRRLGLPHTTVGRYAKGERVPDEERGALLESIAGIPRRAWVVVAPAAPAAPPTRRATAPTTTAPDAAEPSAGPLESRTLAELQARLRQIPGELAELRASVGKGTTTTTAAETLRRLLADEAKALAGAIASSGLATNEEVEQLRALMLGVVQGCEGCKTRVLAALRALV